MLKERRNGDVEEKVLGVWERRMYLCDEENDGRRWKEEAGKGMKNEPPGGVMMEEEIEEETEGRKRLKNAARK